MDLFPCFWDTYEIYISYLHVQYFARPIGHGNLDTRPNFRAQWKEICRALLLQVSHQTQSHLTTFLELCFSFKIVDENSDDDGEMLKLREKTKDELREEDEDYNSWLEIENKQNKNNSNVSEHKLNCKLFWYLSCWTGDYSVLVYLTRSSQISTVRHSNLQLFKGHYQPNGGNCVVKTTDFLSEAILTYTFACCFPTDSWKSLPIVTILHTEYSKIFLLTTKSPNYFKLIKNNILRIAVEKHNIYRVWQMLLLHCTFMYKN